MNIKRSTLQPRLLELAARPEGYRISEIAGKGKEFSYNQAADLSALMVNDGRLFKAKLSFKHVVYFRTAEAALAAERKHQQSLPSVITRSIKAPWPPDAPMVITAATKITIVPSKMRADPLRTNTHSTWGG